MATDDLSFLSDRVRQALSADEQVLAQLHSSAWQRHATLAVPAAEAAQPVLAVVGAGRGRVAQEIHMPPTLQCIEWLQELDSKFSHELLLKLELLDRLQLHCSARRATVVHASKLSSEGVAQFARCRGPSRGGGAFVAAPPRRPRRRSRR